ncbi:hypothetical protein [Barnesiella sp. An55]|uniref:hypothetical protein n=1 Tax=Barnesiella sp. An55 TaxID=1965646 RepID=UPI000B380364|nr:hypothetical protein [Barnesiella sp. An55]OUN73938.1 hypothetical protein B5G10_02615 [Barnesiella sp. An55]
MDFSEIIVAIIIGLVILAINTLGSKKQQSSQNQPRRQPGQSPFPEESTSKEDDEEEWGAPRTKTLDEIFQELRRAREEEEQRKMAREEDDYIPRSPQRRVASHPQPQPVQARTPSRPQPLERRQPQTEWRPKPYPTEKTVEEKVQAQPPTQVSTPAEEGESVFAHTAQPQLSALLSQTNEPNDVAAIDVSDIDWRKAIIASEILNRKY